MDSETTNTFFMNERQSIRNGITTREIYVLKKHRNWTLLRLFCIITCSVSLSIDGYSKDIELDEVPKSIQKIVFRIIGDLPIDDIDREKDDGQVIYDVEAEGDGIRIELEITEDGTIKEKDIHEDISSSDLPIPVQDTVRRHVGNRRRGTENRTRQRRLL